MLRLESPAFENHGVIPIDYTGDGKNLSPPLGWSGVPEGTWEFALICEDPDAPGRTSPFVHWVIYRISGEVRSLHAGLKRVEDLGRRVGAVQGRNSFREIGYSGPLPPVGHGFHRYIFTLYALDEPMPLGPGASKDELLQKMSGHVLATAERVGIYRREAMWQRA